MTLTEINDLLAPLTLAQQTRAAILVAWEVCEIKEWRRWATKWLSGEDLAQQSAERTALVTWSARGIWTGTAWTEAAVGTGAALSWTPAAGGVQQAEHAAWAIEHALLAQPDLNIPELVARCRAEVCSGGINR
jgi:hypothetical protein